MSPDSQGVGELKDCLGDFGQFRIDVVSYFARAMRGFE
jgi:hypothetical protein